MTLKLLSCKAVETGESCGEDLLVVGEGLGKGVVRLCEPMLYVKDDGEGLWTERL